MADAPKIDASAVAAAAGGLKKTETVEKQVLPTADDLKESKERSDASK